MIKYIIIDDEHIAHDVIKGYCDMLPDMKFQQSCYDALEAIQYLNQHTIDLIFLDLNMPKLKGFDFLKTLTTPPKVIVTTAYSEFALEGYELNVSDYLLKPFSFERFLKAINKTFVTPKHSSPTLHADNASKTTQERIFIQSDNKYVQVIIEDILYIEASGNYCKVVTQEGTIITRDKISNLITILPVTDFIQVHRSFVVAAQHIKSIEGNMIHIGGSTVPVGKVYKMNVSRLLGL
ncbi:LytTR family DNA-binding domain-containing protein [Fulvivirga kasyanovii]|uniref:Response regulator transcription factor n=1 Tax=Fulvivirga kasyanovii TaxID=396812 RepID=A0ABW9RS61_9BACT|nr:LytTR family DNA-binding domain-containing protein [Fulvivirga kasyanovii]MTI26866.1 response regulator transcription factor [Fulvivirga kasyanovii]